MAIFIVCEWFLVAWGQNGDGVVRGLILYYTGSYFPKQSNSGKDLIDPSNEKENHFLQLLSNPRVIFLHHPNILFLNNPLPNGFNILVPTVYYIMVTKAWFSLFVCPSIFISLHPSAEKSISFSLSFPWASLGPMDFYLFSIIIIYGHYSFWCSNYLKFTQ